MKPRRLQSATISSRLGPSCSGVPLMGTEPYLLRRLPLLGGDRELRLLAVDVADRDREALQLRFLQAVARPDRAVGEDGANPVDAASLRLQPQRPALAADRGAGDVGPGEELPLRTHLEPAWQLHARLAELGGAGTQAQRQLRLAGADLRDRKPRLRLPAATAGWAGRIGIGAHVAG